MSLSSLQNALRTLLDDVRNLTAVSSDPRYVGVLVAAALGVAMLGVRGRRRPALPAPLATVRIVQHTANVWTFDSSDLLRWHVAGCFPVCMTVIKLTDGSLLVYSPLDLDVIRHALPRKLEEQLGGPVRHIVCPNLAHHLWAPAWKKAYPDATLYVAPGLPAKVPNLPFDKEFTTDSVPPEGFPKEVQVTFVGGLPLLNEVVLFHEPSATLLVCDVAFNFKPWQISNFAWPLRLYLGLAGGSRPLCVTKTFRFLVKDKGSVNAAFQRIMSLPFERIVPCHGDVVAKDARRLLADGSVSFFATL